MQSTAGQLSVSCSLSLYYSKTWACSNGSQPVLSLWEKEEISTWFTLTHQHIKLIHSSTSIWPNHRPYQPLHLTNSSSLEESLKDKLAPQHVAGSVGTYVRLGSRNWKLFEHLANHLGQRSQSFALEASRVSTTRHLYTSPTAAAILQTAGYPPLHVSTRAMLAVNVGRNLAGLRLSNGTCCCRQTYSTY